MSARRISQYSIFSLFFCALSFFVIPGNFARADLNQGIAAYDGGDYSTALREIRAAAHNASPMAQTILAGFYLLGDGVAQDYRRARIWYLRAALKGSENAQLNLGFIYRDGLGVVHDMIKAHVWFAIATHQNAHHKTYLSALEKRMSREDITKARAQAILWLKHNTSK